MEYHLETFATWLREDMALSDDFKIVIDRAAIPTDRKRRPTTRWDHLAKQQSFTMPKVPSRRRLGNTIEEDTATENCPRMIKQSSFCLPKSGAGSRLDGDGDEGAARPGMGVKQTSLSSLPRQTSFKNLTEDEQMEMPRLLKQSSFKSLPRELCDANQTIGSRPKHPSRPQRRYVSTRDSPKPYHRPKLTTVRKNDSKSDATADTLSSMPRLLKQTSFTVAGHSSRRPLIGDDEKEGNGIDRRLEMAKQDSLTILRRRTLTCDRKTRKLDEKNDTLSSNPRLVKQTSVTVEGHSSRGALIGNDENVANGSDRRQQMAKQNSLTAPRRRSLMCDRETGNMDEKYDTTLSSYPRLVKQTSLTGARLSSRGPLIGNDENVANGSNRRLQMAKQISLTTPRRPARFDSEENPFETTNSLSSTRRLVEQAQHLYNGKAHVSASEVRLGCSIARTTSRLVK